MNWYAKKEQELLDLHVTSTRFYMERVALEKSGDNKPYQQLLTNRVILIHDQIKRLETPVPEEILWLIAQFKLTGYSMLSYIQRRRGIEINLKPANFFKEKNLASVLRKFERKGLEMSVEHHRSVWVNAIEIRVKAFDWMTLYSRSIDICKQERLSNGSQEEQS